MKHHKIMRRGLSVLLSLLMCLTASSHSPPLGSPGMLLKIPRGYLFGGVFPLRHREKLVMA